MRLLFHFGTLTEGLGIDERPFFGDTLLQNVCSISDTRNWIPPEGIIANFGNVLPHLMKVFESAYAAILFDVYPEISSLLPEKELTNIIYFTNLLSNQILLSLEIWTLPKSTK